MTRLFFGELHFTDDTYFIFCDDEKLLGKRVEDHAAVTPSTLLKKHYICISDEYLDIDILAHEITHAELHTRLSRKALKRVPTWFDEGLATQNDYRENYSEEQWVRLTDNGKSTVALEDMDTPQEFYAGEKEDRRFRYCYTGTLKDSVHTDAICSELIDSLPLDQSKILEIYYPESNGDWDYGEQWKFPYQIKTFDEAVTWEDRADATIYMALHLRGCE